MGSFFLMVALLAFAFFALIIISVLKVRGAAEGAEEVVFETRTELFSPAERSFFGVLEQAVAGEFRVIGKVRLGDLIQPAKRLTPKRRTILRNRVQQKHVDFVLCCPDSLSVVAAVELDDVSHRRRARADRDVFVDKALISAGLPLLRFSARKGYVVAQIRESLAAAIGRKGTGSIQTSATVSVRSELSAESPASETVSTGAASAAVATHEENAPPAEKTPSARVSEVPVCPSCNISMVKRQARKGPNAGKWFWACTGYPKCRKVLAIV